MVVLLTGFEPNDDDDDNTSERVVRSLIEAPPAEAAWFHDVVRCEIMPGDTRALEAALLGALDRHRPEVCVFTGQAPGRSEITVERIATNLRDFRLPDRAGNLIRAEVTVDGGPAAYWSTWPDLSGLVDALRREAIPAAASNHAGNHLCNQLLYLGLHHAPRRAPSPAVGFVHLPLLPDQVIRERRGAPSMPLAVLRRALIVILEELLSAAPRRRREAHP